MQAPRVVIANSWTGSSLTRTPPEKRCVGCGPTPPEEKGKDTFCNMAGFFDTQFFDGMNDEVLMMFETEFGFKLGEIGDYSCEDTVSIIGEVLEPIFVGVLPGFAWVAEEGIQIAEAACALKDTFGNR